MQVIPEPAEGTRFVVTAEHHAGSQASRGMDGSCTFLCGKCRDILVKNHAPDDDVLYDDDPETGEFVPRGRVRDLVYRCKNCGAFNEVPSQLVWPSPEPLQKRADTRYLRSLVADLKVAWRSARRQRLN